MLPPHLDLLVAAPETAQSPLDLLAACHRRIEQRLDVLPRIAEALRSEDPIQIAKVPDAARFALSYFQSGLQRHTADEDLDFFPILRKLDAELDAVIVGLEADHRAFEFVHNDLDSVLAQLLQSPRPQLADRLETITNYLAPLYRRHLQTEEDRLFTRAHSLLDAAQLSALGARFCKRRGL